MPLDREQLIALSEQYFEACNQHDFQGVMDTMAEDCLMRFPSATFVYRDKKALDIHFKDFLGTFPEINFCHYTHIVDPTNQSIVTYFDVRLIDGQDKVINMQNCNIFHVDQQGVFKEIIIYNSGALDAGFHAGSD